MSVIQHLADKAPVPYMESRDQLLLMWTKHSCTTEQRAKSMQVIYVGALEYIVSYRADREYSPVQSGLPTFRDTCADITPVNKPKDPRPRNCSHHPPSLFASMGTITPANVQHQCLVSRVWSIRQVLRILRPVTSWKTTVLTVTFLIYIACLVWKNR